MRLVVTGGSSFVGAWFCQVAAREHDVVALVHATRLGLNGVTPVRVDLRNPRAVRRIRRLGADALVHVATRIRVPGARDPAAAAAAENRAMMDTVLALGLPVVYASSTVVHWTRPSPYRDGRIEDERRLAASGLPYAIVRPSAPYGPRLLAHRPRHTESFHKLADLVRRSPVVPVIGDGRYRRQPVHVVDFARAILGLLDRGLPNRAFDAGGADALTMDEIVDILAETAGRKVVKLHLPKALFVRLARLDRDFDPALVAAADEDELADPAPLAEASGVRPRGFREGARDLVAPRSSRR